MNDTQIKKFFFTTDFAKLFITFPNFRFNEYFLLKLQCNKSILN